MLKMQQAYHGFIVTMWPMFKQDLATAPTITGPYDPRWIEICNRYESLINQAPAEIRDYVDSQVRVHIYELEKFWRFEK